MKKLLLLLVLATISTSIFAVEKEEIKEEVTIETEEVIDIEEVIKN